MLCVGMKLISATCIWNLLSLLVVVVVVLVLVLVVVVLYDWAKVSLPISCASHRLEQFICEKSHLLHAPPWSLLTCDVIFT